MRQHISQNLEKLPRYELSKQLCESAPVDRSAFCNAALAWAEQFVNRGRHAMAHGYAERILRVDLSTHRTWTEPLPSLPKAG